MNHVPVMTGGVGREELREFYAKHFIPKMPADTQIIPISRTIGGDSLVDEMIIRLPTTSRLTGCFPESLLPESAWNSRRLPLFSFARESYTTSISTGIRPLCSYNSGFWTPENSRLRA